MNAQMMILLYAVLLFVVIYFMMVVPGKKKNKKMQELHDSIKVGDEILTMGGIIATVKERDGEILTVEIDPEKEICMKILVYYRKTLFLVCLCTRKTASSSFFVVYSFWKIIKNQPC